MEELRASAEPDCVIFLVGNQVDRVEMNPSLRQVPTETARKYAESAGLKFEETSAVTNAKVTDVFDNLLHCTNHGSYIISFIDIHSVKLSSNQENNSVSADGKKYKKLQDFQGSQGSETSKPCC